MNNEEKELNMLDRLPTRDRKEGRFCVWYKGRPTTQPFVSFIKAKDACGLRSEIRFRCADGQWRTLAEARNNHADFLELQRAGALGTPTGRLSGGTSPNIQNIPVHTPEGAAIRAAFVGKEA